MVVGSRAPWMALAAVLLGLSVVLLAAPRVSVGPEVQVVPQPTVEVPFVGPAVYASLRVVAWPDGRGTALLDRTYGTRRVQVTRDGVVTELEIPGGHAWAEPPGAGALPTPWRRVEELPELPLPPDLPTHTDRRGYAVRVAAVRVGDVFLLSPEGAPLWRERREHVLRGERRARAAAALLSALLALCAVAAGLRPVR